MKFSNIQKNYGEKNLINCFNTSFIKSYILSYFLDMWKSIADIVEAICVPHLNPNTSFTATVKRYALFPWILNILNIYIHTTKILCYLNSKDVWCVFENMFWLF